MQSKLLVVRSYEMAKRLKDLFPDFHVTSISSCMTGYRFDSIVIALGEHYGSRTDKEHEQNAINHLRCHVVPGGEFVVL